MTESKRAANFRKYIDATREGKKLLSKHSLNEYGIWHVRGEDSNCDLGGYHHMPTLGYFEGTLKDVIMHAVMLPSFWQWGAGGSFTLYKEPLVQKISDINQEENDRNNALAKLSSYERKLLGV